MESSLPRCDADNLVKQADAAAKRFLSVIDVEALPKALRASIAEDVAEIMADVREELGLSPEPPR